MMYVAIYWIIILKSTYYRFVQNGFFIIIILLIGLFALKVNPVYVLCFKSAVMNYLSAINFCLFLIWCIVRIICYFLFRIHFGAESVDTIKCLWRMGSSFSYVTVYTVYGSNTRCSCTVHDLHTVS